MSKFPEPPSVAQLAALGPELHVLTAATLLFRIYLRAGRHPTAWNTFRAWGPTSSRFDHHLPPPRVQSRQILYAARNPITCFAEVFQETRVVDRGRHQATLVAFEVTRSLALLDLTGTWPTRAGASMSINSGPRARARAWSRQVHAAFPGVDGVYYPSSMHANQPSIALYERATNAMPQTPTFHRLLSDPDLLAVVRRAAHTINYGLV